MFSVVSVKKSYIEKIVTLYITCVYKTECQINIFSPVRSAGLAKTVTVVLKQLSMPL